MKQSKLDLDTRNALESWIEKHFDKIHRSGDEWNLQCPDSACPSYGTSKFKLYYNVKNGIGWCFRCETPFSMVDIVRTVEGVSWSVAKEKVNSWRGIYIKSGGLVDRIKALRRPEEEDEIPIVELPTEFIPCDRDHFPAYIKGRMSLKDARRYRVGYCMRGFYQGRVIVPVYMPEGLRTFVARLMRKQPRLTTTQKVIGPKEAKKSYALFNYQALRNYKSVVLVEGVFDAIYGGSNYLALLGTYVSDYQLGLLRDSDVDDIVILFDADAKFKTHKVAQLLRRNIHRARIRVAYLDRDPDEYPKEELHRIVETAGSPKLSSLVARM